MKKWLHGNVLAGALLVCLMPLIALTAKGDGIKIPTIWPPRTLPQAPAQNGDGPSVGSERIVEVKNADINPWSKRTNCYEVVFWLESKVANTNLWVDFTAYSEDNFPFFIGDSISFDSCQSYTNEIVVAVGPDGKSEEITFIWDRGRYNRAAHGVEEAPVHHAVIEARYPDEDVTVKCKNGRFVGLKNSVTGVCSFKSVPFAKPARRWLPPEDPDPSDAVISARQFGPAAAQTYEPSEYASRGPISEDCLKLTVWTADGFDPNNPNRAVMFFIHGGSYVLGGMCDPLYDGANIVMSNPDVIVVSCDYRLCAFGFLDLNELPGFDPIAHAAYAQAPNLGILDQQAGLRWVKDNIASFGGNPDNVTIFGESAGGGSVSCLLQAKGSEGLFKRAIVMSGTVDLTDSPALYKGSNQALLLMKAADKNSFGKLLECNTDELINALNVSLTDPRLAGIPHIASREGGSTVADMNNRPMCDDARGIVPSDPFASFATNAVAKDVDVMIGSTSEELNYWAHLMFNIPHSNGPLGYYYDFLSNGVSRSQNIYTQLGYGSEVLEFLRDVSTTHPFDRDERFNLGGQYPEIWGRTELRSELAFRIPSIIMAEQHLKQVADLDGSGKTYMYYFCRPQVNPAEPWIGACHASELTSVFKNIYLDVDSSNRVELATRVSGAFVNFAKYGDPNGDPSAVSVADAEKDSEVEEWKTYDVTNRNTMVIGEIGSFTNSTMRLVSDPKRRQRELLEEGYLGYHAKVANGLEAPAGSPENPWQLGPKTNQTEIIAWTNGMTLAVVKGAVTNEYPLTAGQYIVAQEATLQKPNGAWNGRVEVNCLLFDPMSGSKQFGSNLKLGLSASVSVKRLHRRVLGQLDHEDLMVNLTGAPQFETLIWDAAMDGVQKEGDVGIVTAMITPPSDNPDCSVVVSNGTFVGVLDGATHVRSWKGIPYAQQPTGPRRWKKVGDPAADAWTYSAKWFGHAPIQTLSPDEPSALDQGEDCLVLNVWSSDDSSVPMKDRPVAVYIHGGGFMQGCTTDNLYDGRPIVERNPDIVVVTINYRVSYLSFIDLTGVPGAEDYPDAHNLGILDQRQALKWVHDNIAAFGGDPEKVTIFGESAGGGSVSVHLTSPESAPYFKRVLQMSGALDMTMSEGAFRNRNLTPSIRAEVARMRFKDVSRSNEVDMAMLRSLTAAELRALVSAPIGDPEAPEWEAPMGGLCGGDATISAAICSPMRDDSRGCVPYKPFDAFATNGVANVKDYMVGTTGQESRHFVWQSSPDDPLLDFYSGFLYDHLRCDMYWVKTDEKREIISNYLKTVETELDEMDARYPGIWKLAALEDQLFMRLPAIKMADIHAGLPAKEGVKGKTFMYRFDKGVESADKPWTKACHGCELAYFFGNTGYTFEGPIDEGLATKVCTAFANFVRTGDPNDDGKTRGTVGGTEWTEYDAVNRKTMLFNNDCTLSLVSDPDKSAREQLMPLYDDYDEGHHGEAPSRRMSGIKYELKPLPPAGTASDPWQVGTTTEDDVVAYTNSDGKVFFEGTGAMRDFYAVDGGLWFGSGTVAAEFGAGVTSIGANTLAASSGIASVIVRSEVPPALGDNALPRVEQLNAILVPSASVEAYKTDWPKYADVITAYFAADTVVYGTVRTADEANLVAEAIVIKDGRYVYVGDESGATAFVQDGVTKVIDHRGKGMVMPGCTDGHSHYANTFAMGNMKGGVLFGANDDKDAVLQKLSAAASAAHDAGKQSLCGFGWSMALLKDDRPSLSDLDAATPGISAVIFDSSGHHAFCNSECLRRCGIIDGHGGVLISKIDGGLLELVDGYPTGYLNERTTGYLTRMGGIDADELIDDTVAEGAIRRAQELLLSSGYTSVLDAWSNNLHSNKFYEVAKRMDDDGNLKLAVAMTYEVEPWQTNMTEQIDILASLKGTYGTRHVRPEYLKVFMDGVVESRTGALLEPYLDGTLYKSFWSVDRLTAITTNCNARGLTVHVHTMGDAAIKETTDAYVEANKLRGDSTYRNCMVHLRNVRTEDFQRIAENNIACAAGLTWHAADKHQVEYQSTILEPQYVHHAYPVKSFFDAGVKVSSHSDYPANIPCPYDPFGIMHVAVNGLLPNCGPDDFRFDTNELVTVEQAFQALTINGAWQLGLENERGSIKVGKFADFVLADRDVFACAEVDIGKTKVVSTWFEGEKVYQAPEGSEANPWLVGKSAGDTVFAYTNGTGRLVILGEGSMKDFGDGAPWKSCVIREIEIGFGPDKIGVTNIGANAFANLTDVTSLVFHCFKTPAFGAGAFDGLGGVTVMVPCGSSGEYEEKLEEAGLEDFTVIHPEPQWSDCRKIADYLYEIWYDGDYTDDECDLNGNPLGVGKASACSAVRNGIFYGRNLDLPYMAVPNIVAHFAATETRYKSMSVMTPSFMTVDEDAGEILAEKYSEALNIAPSATMTGINEFGVTCNSNVMPISDGTNCVYQIFGEKVIPDMSPAGGTHPEYSASFNLNVGTSVQFVLDNATNAVDAIRKLNGRNVYGGLGTIDYIQLMIADPERTFVVEFLGPYMLVIGFGSEDTAEALEAEFADVAASAKVRFANNKQKSIMTNWWHFFDQYPDTVAFTNRQNHANGVERYRALDRYYDESATFEGMRELMKLVKFSNCGTLRPGVDEFYPFTDNNVPPRPSWQDFASDENALDYARWFTNQYCETVFEKRERGDFRSNWITAHSVVIDMKNRLLDIVSWEEWDDPHRFYSAEPEGTEDNPWFVGEMSPGDVTAYVNGTTLVFEGDGTGVMKDFEIGTAPWADEVITDCVVGSNVTVVGENAIAGYPELDTVVLYGQTPPEFGAGNYLDGKKIFVPTGAADGYREAWPAFADQIEEMRSARRELSKHLYEIEYRWWNADKANSTAENLAGTLRTLALLKEIYEYFMPYQFVDWYNGASASALCTSCRNGNFVGRNFDWGYDDVDECVMHVPAAEGRLASVGVASRFFPQLLQDVFGVEEFLPELTMDGVNEKGVAMNVNVVPAGDNGETTGTNPGAERLCAGFAVRPVLDAATSAAHAVEILRSRDIYSIKGLEFHWMISDATESYIVECVQNELVVLRAKNARPKMANFYVSHSPSVYDEYEVVSDNVELTEDEHTPHAMGIERYNRVAAGLESVDSVASMFTRMTNVWYKLKYLPGNEGRYWSDLNGAPVPGGEDGQRFTVFDDPEELSEVRSNAFKALQANYVAVTNYEARWGIRDTLKNDPTLTNQVVHTVHTSIYDLEKRELTVCVQEDVRTIRTFGLFGECALGSEQNPWKVGTEGHESEVTAWTNGTGALVVEGTGAVGSMPWVESASGITDLVKAKGVTGLETLVGSLPDVEYVNGLASGEFMQAALGFVKASGFSAIEVKDEQALLDVVIARSAALDESAEWTPVSTNSVMVPAPGEQGFFIVVPSLPSNWFAPVPMPPIPVR